MSKGEFIVDREMGIPELGKLIRAAWAKHKYLRVRWEEGVVRSLDQNALLHVWISEFAAHVLKKPKKEVTKHEKEAMKITCKFHFYQETGCEWMLIKVADMFTQDRSAIAWESTADYGFENMFVFMTWIQTTAFERGLTLESKGEYQKLQKSQTA